MLNVRMLLAVTGLVVAFAAGAQTPTAPDPSAPAAPAPAAAPSSPAPSPAPAPASSPGAAAVAAPSAAASASAVDPVAAHACTKPGEHPGRQAPDANRRKWTIDANAYLECLKKYALEHQAIAKPLYDQAKPHADAANAAIDEYNQAVKSLKEEAEKNNN